MGSSPARYYERLIEQIQKRIALRPQHPKAATAIQKEYGLSPVAARILAARGYRSGPDLKNFLEPTLKEGLPDPRNLTGLMPACERVREIIASGKPIAVCCDFDVDGLSGGAQVAHFLSASGARAEVFVPDRFEDGYGLNEKIVRDAASRGFGLILTVDYGTTNSKELELAQQLGLATIVIDHHHVHSPPSGCDVFINPQQRGCGFADGVLSAAGLAWYFVTGLRSTLKHFSSEASLPDARSYLDLACLGTICDMVPLRGANRVIARRGLELLATTKRPGLQALKKVAGINGEVSCYDVSFGIGPRLNAAGRMVHGRTVVELLTTPDSIVAAHHAGRLNRWNVERQETEAVVKDRALEKLHGRYGASGLPAGVVIADDDFHTGVVGIVAQRLVEMFYRPTVVLGLDKDDHVLKGSVRGIKGFSVIEALSAVGPTLLKFGGHEGAGGLSLARDSLADFTDAFILECARQLSSQDSIPTSEADTEVNLEEITVDLVQELKRFAPFGMGNPGPLLLVKGLKIVDTRELKGTHLKITLTDGHRYIAGLLWRQTSHPAVTRGAMVNIVCRADYSTFNGITELQANLQAIERS